MTVRKMVIIGAGFVGSTIAYSLLMKDFIDELVLIDIDEKKLHGEIFDLRPGLAEVSRSRVRAGDFCDCADADILVMAAGSNRKPGQTRMELFQTNLGILRETTDRIAPHYRGAKVVVVSNPVDLLTFYMAKYLPGASGRVIGTGCLLDTARLCALIAEHVQRSVSDVETMVVGVHGDEPIALWSQTRICRQPIGTYFAAYGVDWMPELRKSWMEQVRTMGMDIIEAKGRTHYGIAAVVCRLVQALSSDKPQKAAVGRVTMWHGRETIVSLPTVLHRTGITPANGFLLEVEEENMLNECAERMSRVLCETERALQAQGYEEKE